MKRRFNSLPKWEKMKTNFYLKALIGAILLTLLYWLIGQIVLFPYDFAAIGWNILANYLVAFVLGYYVLHAIHRGWKLTGVVFAIFFIIGHFNILIEALIFNVTDQTQTLKELFVGFMVTAIFSPLYVKLLNQWEGQAEGLVFQERLPAGWTWRILVADLLYFIIYAIAGFTLQAVYPELLEFYEGKIPPFPLIIKTQFLRGFIFIAIALLVLRSSNLTMFKKALLTGLLFSILGGIAPLLPPNAHMPAYIRWGHGFEVGISNFLYGLTIAYLLGQKIVSKIKKLA